ncbi:MAG: hypothetical protein ABIV94_12145 [Acidimicrobiales bacterium]
MTPAPDHISRHDLESKMRELAGEVGVAKEHAASYAIVIGAVAVVAVVGIAFLIGRRRGRKRSTVVEVRRM